MFVAIIIVVIIALIVIVNCVKIVPQAHAVVVERLGGYLTTWSVGLHLRYRLMIQVIHNRLRPLSKQP